MTQACSDGGIVIGYGTCKGGGERSDVCTTGDGRREVDVSNRCRREGGAALEDKCYSSCERLGFVWQSVC